MVAKIAIVPTALMATPDRPESATALARSPLFSHLGRLDLARLAGELEEKHFGPGQAICRQGDRPDGFYVIKHGRAAVLAGTTSTPAAGDGTGGEPLTTLGPGEVFGEMALLTDSPRTATVVAETDLTVWRLSALASKRSSTWWRWFLIALPPFVVIGVVTYLALLFLFKPHRTGRVSLDAVRLQQALLGPLTRNEIWSAVVLVLLIAGFASRPYHGIAPAWLALGAFLFLFALGALDQSAFQGGGTLGLLVYSGVILSLGNVFATLHIDAWLTSLVQSGIPAMVKNPYGFVLTISIIAFALHFFVPWMTASTIIALVAMPIAEGLGFHPFIPVLVALIAGDHTILPYVNSGYAILYFASEGDLFTHAQARWPLVLESLLRPVALLLSVPVWQLMGLM